MSSNETSDVLNGAPQLEKPQFFARLTEEQRRMLGSATIGDLLLVQTFPKAADEVQDEDAHASEVEEGVLEEGEAAEGVEDDGAELSEAETDDEEIVTLEAGGQEAEIGQDAEHSGDDSSQTEEPEHIATTGEDDDHDSGFEDQPQSSNTKSDGVDIGFKFLQLGHDLDEYRFNRFGFDREGYNAEGYDQNGYDRDGYDTQGLDKDGYDYEGYDRADRDRYGHGRYDDDDEGAYSDSDVKISLFAIIGMVRDEIGAVVDLHLQRLEHSDSVSRANGKAYRLYPGEVEVHDKKSAFGFDMESETLSGVIGDVTSFESTLTIKPSDEEVRRALQDYGDWNHGCNNGFCHSQHEAQDLITETLPQLTHFEPVCPVCMGKDLLNEHFALRQKVDDSTLLDLAEVFNWLGKVNSIREDQGLSLIEFDDRAWGFSFDEEAFADGNFTRDADGSVWQAPPAEALDAAAVNIVTERPAATDAVNALPRLAFHDLEIGDESAECQICCEAMEQGEVFAQMPCSLSSHDECVKSWLGAQNTCPNCRHTLPVAEDDEQGSEGEGHRPQFQFEIVGADGGRARGQSQIGIVGADVEAAPPPVREIRFVAYGEAPTTLAEDEARAFEEAGDLDDTNW